MIFMLFYVPIPRLQDFSMSETLVQGQGNFGSIDDDPAAAVRRKGTCITRHLCRPFAICTRLLIFSFAPAHALAS
jgi:hypothetical protein